jgi:hypothetical protein
MMKPSHKFVNGHYVAKLDGNTLSCRSSEHAKPYAVFTYNSRGHSKLSSTIWSGFTGLTRSPNEHNVEVLCSHYLDLIADIKSKL